jgi:uncharacterized iron-regulated protein
MKLISAGPHAGPEEIYALPEGDKLPFEELAVRLRPSRIIFMGEVHDQMDHHRNQVRVLRELSNGSGPVVVAMEMFQRSQQSVLDRWTRGGLTEELFLKEVNWEKTWGIDYSYYKGILDLARDHRIKVLGLNIPKDLVRKVAQGGMESLSEEDRRNLPDMDLKDPDHRRFIRSIFDRHKEGTAKVFDHFYQAQCLWDEAMAETLSHFLRSPEGANATVLVVAGNGHVVYDFGIPKRVSRRITLTYRTVVQKEWRNEWDEDLLFSHSARPPADFLWITPPAHHAPKRPRIGVVLKEDEDPHPVRIERVIPGSPAEKAGLLPGDRFLMVDGKGIQTLKDLHDAVAHRTSEKGIEILLLRGDEQKEFFVLLPSPKE